MNRDEHHAEERARQAYLSWQEAQQRRTRAADRAARLALELKAANQRLERKTLARAEQLAQMKRELEARRVMARTAFARRVELHEAAMRAIALPERKPLPRYVAPAMIAMTLLTSQVVTGSPERTAVRQFTPAKEIAGDNLKLKLSTSLSLQKTP